MGLLALLPPSNFAVFESQYLLQHSTLKLFKLIFFLSVTFFLTQVNKLLVAANTSFRASSSRYPMTPQDSILSGNKTWCAEFDDDMQYLVIDLVRNSYVTEIITQGAVDQEAWVETYTVSYGHSGDVWKRYKENGTLKVICTKIIIKYKNVKKCKCCL